MTGFCYAQPDHYIVFPTHVLLIECKLSQKSRAFPQMGLLYVPLLREIYNLPIVGVQACKNLYMIPKKYLVDDIRTLFTYSGSEEMLTWHAFEI